MRNKIFLTIGILLALGAIWYKLSTNTNSVNKEIMAERQPVPFAVEATVLQEQETINNQSYSGTIETPGTIKLASEIDGRILTLNVQAGSRVRRGQLIATVDVESRNNANDINWINYSKAKVDHQRLSDLFKLNNATKVEMESALQVLKTAEKQFKISTAELGKGKLFSPIDGIVTNKSVSAGDFVSVGSAIAVIVPFSSVDIRCYIPEREISKVQIGSAVDFSADAYPGLIFKGTIKALIPAANLAKTYPIIVKVVNDQHGVALLDGMTVSVDITDSKPSYSLLIPRTAIRGDLSAPYVWVIDINQKAVRRAIKIGKEKEEAVEITSGLNLGETIITKGQSNLTEGMVLKSIKIVGTKHQSNP